MARPMIFPSPRFAARNQRNLRGTLFSLFVVWSMLLSLTGCGSLPQPFGRDGTQPATIQPNLVAGAGIVVTGIDNGGAFGEKLSHTVVGELQRREIPAASTGGNQRSSRLSGTLGGHRSGAAIYWSLAGADGALRGRLTQPLGTAIDEPCCDQRRMDVLAAQASRWVIGLINPALESGSLRPVVSVPHVVGAPGDGSNALSRAMARALEADGAVIDSASYKFLVLGSVFLRDIDQRRQEVEIVWEVLDDSGSRLGEVSQGNTIPAGRLDRVWGEIAVAVANAGAPGILEVVRRAIPR